LIMRTIIVVLLLALTIIGARAQVQPGPNIGPGGPFTYSPRFGYLGPPRPMPPGPTVLAGTGPGDDRQCSVGDIACKCAEQTLQDGEVAESTEQKADYDRCIARAQRPPAQVTVAPSPPPLGWVYGPYTSCADPPRCSQGVVNVQADGLNVRTAPNGPAVMALVNGTPFVPLQREGNWFLIAPVCELTPTWAWSWTANVPLNRCWVYFP
jgi:hypothetical protein